MQEKIWYCSYGSNLSYERFNLYIFGGSSRTIEKNHTGCSDKTKAEKAEFFEIPYELYFSDYLAFWNGAVAFISDRKSSEKRTLSRMYLISHEQFNEVVEQENGHFENSNPFSLDLEELRKNGFVLLGPKDKNIKYGKILLVGEKDGFPIVTFTAKWSVDNITYTKPSERYLKTILSGLIESDISKEELMNYLVHLKGIDGFYTYDELRNIIDELYYNKPKHLIVKGTSDVKRDGQYWVVLPKNIFGKESWNNPDFCLLTRHDSMAELKARVKYVDNDRNSGIIQMDMKYRCALSINVGSTIRVSPIREKDKNFVQNKTGGFKKFLNRTFGVQTNIVRVSRASYNDMEVNVCRISEESMNIIGVEHGDFVILESPYGRVKVRALQKTKTIEEEMDKRRENKNVDYDCEKNLDIDKFEENKSDIQKILIDSDIRNKLYVSQCTPIQIRRSLGHEIRKKIHFVATPLVLTILSLIISLEYFQDISFKIFAIILGTILVVLLALVPIKKI